MKHLKLILILSIILQFNSCSNDDNEESEITNKISFNNVEYEANLLYKTQYSGYYELILTDTNIPYTDYNGNMNFVGVLFQGDTINEGTYTFKLDTETDFDPNSNFFDTEAGIELNINNGIPDTTSNYYENISTGSMTITKNGEIYAIEFSLDFGGEIIEGNYSGEIID